MYSIGRGIITVFQEDNLESLTEKQKEVLVYSGALEYNKINFLHMFKGYNKKIGKPDESLGRKATGPVKWQPVA